MFPKPISVKPKANYSIGLFFDDGTKGEIDLSHLAHKGIFKQWDENNLFQKVYLDAETHAIAWNEDLEIGYDTLYLKLLGINFQEWKERQFANATD